MPKKITQAQIDATNAFRNASFHNANAATLEEYNNAYYGASGLALRELFSHSPYMSQLTERSRAVSIGMMAELILHPELSLSELLEVDTVRAKQSKAEAKEFLKKFYREDNPEPISEFNKMYLNGLKIFNQKIKEAMREGSFSDTEKLDRFYKENAILLSGIFDVWGQNISNPGWDKSGLTQEEVMENAIRIQHLTYVISHYVDESLSTWMDRSDTLLKPDVYLNFTNQAMFRPESRDALFKEFGLKRITVDAVQGIDAFEDSSEPVGKTMEDFIAMNMKKSAFHQSLSDISVKKYGVFFKMDEFDRILLMTDPAIHKFVQIENDEEGRLKKVTYAGMDMKYNVPQEQITEQDAEAIKKHMYTHISSTLYRTLDEETQRSIREVRESERVISTVDQDDIRKFGQFAKNVVSDLKSKTSIRGTSEYYEAMVSTIADLGARAENVPLDDLNALKEYEEKIAEAIMAAKDYLEYKNASIMPTPGERFKNSYETNRIAEARKALTMLNNNFAVFSEHVQNAEQSELVNAVQNKYDNHVRYREAHADHAAFMDAEKQFVVSGKKLAKIALTNVMLDSKQCANVVDLMADMCVPYLYINGFQNEEANRPNPVANASYKMMKDAIKNSQVFKDFAAEMTVDKITEFLKGNGAGALVQRAIAAQNQQPVQEQPQQPQVAPRVRANTVPQLH